MKINISNKKYFLQEADGLFIPTFIGEPDLFNEIDSISGNELRDELVATQFSSEFGEWLQLAGGGKIKARKLFLFGLGEKKEFNTEIARRFAGKVIAKAKSLGLKKIVVAINYLGKDAGLIKSLAEGFWLADYRFLHYKKSEKEKHQAKNLDKVILSYSGSHLAAEAEVRDAAIGVLGTTLARDLVNEPSNALRPCDLVKSAIKIADSSKQIEIGVFGKKELEENGFGAFLAVAQGSREEPYLIHLKYHGGGKTHKRIAFVGKGITFDSGGISLKPSDKISDMKVDMAGAATVLGVFRCLSMINLPLEIHGIIATCENMPGPSAVKPGDIIYSYSGKTIEILNTDAEGRLVLADALSYCAKQIMPNIMLDIATLTGACMVALGENIAGFMTRSDSLAKSLESTSKISGEKIWRLPLENDYKEKMKCEIADIKNITDDKFAGAIMGGLFLQEFVPEEIDYAHIDIAGPAYDEKGRISYIAKGGTGFGVRTIVNWLKNLR